MGQTENGLPNADLNSSELKCVHVTPSNGGTGARLRKSAAERVITKKGVCNFGPKNVDKKRNKFINDIFTTALEVRWRWTLLGFCFVYFGSWTLFAVLWYAILYFHGDIDHFGEEGWDPCITGIRSFTQAFLFSVETQHTTGYGFYELTETCGSAVFLFCIQSIVGCILEGLMVGMVFFKMSGAKRRSETIMFSRNAVISIRDGVACLMFRIADMRRTPLVEAHVRAQIVKKRLTAEGEIITYDQQELEVSADGQKEDRLLLLWPTTVIHRMDSMSPLANIIEDDLTEENQSFEVIVVLEGIVEATGLTVQARSSYLPSEILWGRRFENLKSSKTSSGYRAIDYSNFHEHVPIAMEIDLNSREDLSSP